MIREDRFLISRRPYAVNLGSLRITHTSEAHDGRPRATVRLDAAWFRRKQGVTVACIGHLWDIQDPPADALTFLAQHDDGRYGGHCEGRWDGESYWGNVTLDVQQQHLAILQPMLANYPAVPAGWDGWWRF